MYLTIYSIVRIRYEIWQPQQSNLEGTTYERQRAFRENSVPLKEALSLLI